jgi:hypothetical protein
MTDPRNGAGPNVGAFEPVKCVGAGGLDADHHSAGGASLPVRGVGRIGRRVPEGSDRQAVIAGRRAVVAAKAAVYLSFGICMASASAVLRALAARGTDD